MGVLTFKKHYADYYDLFNKDKKYKKEIDFIYKLADSPQPGHTMLLDIGCGTANYWEYWHKLGVAVFGIDKAEHMVANYNKYSFNAIKVMDITTINQKWLDKQIMDYELVTAIFHVINYIPNHKWWKFIPIKKGHYFIFDILDKTKVDNEGFKETIKTIGNISRKIIPTNYDGESVDLHIEFKDQDITFHENHKMYIYSHKDILSFCGEEFEIVKTKETKTWTTWYKLQKK